MSTMRGKQRCWARAAVGLLGGIMLVGLVPSARAGTETRWTYVATEGDSGLLQPVRATETPLGHVAPTGSLWFQATGTSLTLMIDDAARTDSDSMGVHVGVGGVHRLVCLRDGVPVRLTQLPLGTTVSISVHPGPGILPGCTTFATAGSLTVRQ